MITLSFSTYYFYDIWETIFNELNIPNTVPYSPN